MLLNSILNFLFPRYCEICEAPLEAEQKFICINCNDSLPRTRWWEKRNTPVVKYKEDDNIFKEIKHGSLSINRRKEYDSFTENKLATLYYGRIDIERAMAFLKFSPKTKTANLVYGFKYYNKPYIAYYLGEMMGKELMESGFFKNIDYIIPVPITKHRMYEREYNQSYELSRGINKETKIPIEANILKRKRFSVSQTKLNEVERAENIKGVFTLNRNYRKLCNKHVLLIDDIITTGATTLECSKVLKSIQGIRISILSLGFVTI